MLSFKAINRGSSIARTITERTLMNRHRERLIKISQFMVHGTQEMGAIKEGVQDAGERLSELRLLMQGQQVMFENKFSVLEKAEQRKLIQPVLKQRLTFSPGKFKDQILSWLSVADPRSNHDRACKSHMSGTGDWFTKGQKYRNWLTKPKSFFWLNGKVGCGKTILSSTIIESAKKHCDESEGSAVAYFYFSFTDTAKQ
jgi:hypothetical protein